MIRWAVVVVGFALTCWVVLTARQQREAARLRDLIGQGRYGEALAMKPGDLELTGIVRDLDARLTQPDLPGLDHARTLAQLGRPAEAVARLDALPESAETELLRATIAETSQRWPEALARYESARQHWQQRQPTPVREAGLAQANRGMAYCLCKLGRYPEAETAYLAMLRHASSAESHLLLAHFYADAQDATKAREQVRQAMLRDPDGSRRSGDAIVRQLTQSHFGCLSVFSNEKRR